MEVLWRHGVTTASQGHSRPGMWTCRRWLQGSSDWWTWRGCRMDTERCDWCRFMWQLSASDSVS